jgi:hypothetical protein
MSSDTLPNDRDGFNSQPDKSSCPRCGVSLVTLRWRTFRDQTRHIEVKCGACNRFRYWAEQTPEAVAVADAAQGGAL